MTANQIRVAWFALLIGSPVIASASHWPADIFLWILLIGTGVAILGFRRLGESELERNFWCLLVGLAISLALSLIRG